MAEQMQILNAQGQEVGLVVVESLEQQEEIGRILAGQGYRLVEPGAPPMLDRGGDLEADNCDANAPDDVIDNCKVSACVSYVWDFCTRHGIPVPRLDAIIASKRLDSSSEARAAVAEAVEAVSPVAHTLTTKESPEAKVTPLEEIAAYVRYAYPDLAAQLPA